MSCGCTITTLPTYRVGTTWPGFTNGKISQTDSTSSTLQRIRFVFSKGGVTGPVFDSLAGSLPIIINGSWAFEVPFVTPLAVTPGEWAIEGTYYDSAGFILGSSFMNQPVL